MRLATALRSARKKADIGLRELARRVNVHPSHISRVESGKVPASRSLLVALSKELQLDQDSILALGGFIPSRWQRALEKDPDCVTRIYESLTNGRSATNFDGVHEPLPAYAASSAPPERQDLRDPMAGIFPQGFVVSPEINEIYELKLAMLEANKLTREELVERGAYFVSIDGVPTNHFQICTGGGVKLPKDSGARLLSFLGTHQLKTSYATHGLFPYRGKYHPQMIKALINIMGIAPGATVLDPMAGSGTTAIEAAIMGIDSIAVDVSPFCTFMAKTKVAALTADVAGLKELLAKPSRMRKVHDELGKPRSAEKVLDDGYQPRGLSRAAFDILALAFMDAKGYAARSSRKGEFEFFVDILTKYTDTIDRFQKVFRTLRTPLGSARSVEGDARTLNVESESIDGVIFSPPYSFAVDYLENDEPHLRYLRSDIAEIRTRMIGLNGGQGAARVEQYFSDMKQVFDEIARVLKPGTCCTVIVGSNSNQLAKVLGLEPGSLETRYGIQERLTAVATERNLPLELKIRRLIVGMANSMREEHILIFRKRTRLDA